jgi:SAM-dependent methyltransferase
VTQLFTPRWVVDFLLHNTLGKQWMEWHPDSCVGRELKWLVGEVVSDARGGPRLAKEISLLDPACGTGNFLVAAVELLSAMYLEEIDRAGREVVTVIELLSPSNKMPGPDRDQYAGKRLRLTNSRVNFVELDLLRGGPRHSFRPAPPACDYYALVYRPARWPRAGVQAVRLRERLPVIHVPLREGTPDIPVDLQQLLHEVYDAGKYRAYIYDTSPEPPLSPDDAAWAAQFVPARPE